MKKYVPFVVESKWQKAWEKTGLYTAKDTSEDQKYYVLDMFPYPSGDGLHVGHFKGYTATDVISRFLRAKGFNVLHPMGWDAFGLPAENYAIQTGIHPAISTDKNIEHIKAQMKMVGLSYDWDREINTTDADYYRWTQWIFLQLYKKGLAYEAEAPINWCPKDKTGLANEEVVNGVCDRCGTKVVRKRIRQWILAITKYADRLIEDLEGLDWPAPIIEMQRNWIGKSEGIEINFPIADTGIKRFVLLHGRQGSPTTNFFPWLKENLKRAGYEVEAPELPNSENPDDMEQAEYVAKNCKLDSETVVVGHSFGGVVAMRLLEKGVSLKQVVFIATLISGNYLDGQKRPTVTAALKKGFDFEKIKANSRYFTVIADTGDEVVPVVDGEKLSASLSAKFVKTKAEEAHFCALEEPVVLENVLPAIKVYTKFPETIFGVTYMVVAPEYDNLGKLITTGQIKDADDYILEAQNKSDLERTALEKEKTGVFTGSYCINPVNGKKVPIWISDYVIGGYGTGAVMGVPGSDVRDFDFAVKYKLPIIKVIADKKGDVTEIKNKEGVLEDGFIVNSGEFDGLQAQHPAKEKFMDFLEEKGWGRRKVNYKLRDWIFSRQRYWGEPIPIVHCPNCGTVPLPEKDLPLILPKVEKYQPTGTGESPLATIAEWVNTKCPNCKGPAKRETNTMPQWAGSCWYYLRFIDPKNKNELVDGKKEKYWMGKTKTNPLGGVDWYVGGAEHAVLHLLYARFWHKFLFDINVASGKEPFYKLRNVGLIMGPDGQKMSKSRGNVISPEDMVNSYGADTLRIFEMFVGPFADVADWNPRAVEGVYRFLRRIWLFSQQIIESDRKTSSEEVLRHVNALIAKVEADIWEMKFNTSVAAMMEFVNALSRYIDKAGTDVLEKFLLVLAPFAPHMAEEIWQQLKTGPATRFRSIHQESWPAYDQQYIRTEQITIVVQVNGKVRDNIEVDAGVDQASVEKLARASERVAKYLEGEVLKVIFVPGKLVNFVVL